MKWYLKVLYVLSWIPAALIKVIAVLVGFIFVPFALLICMWEPDKPRKETWPDLLWIWGNDEEEVPFWWTERAKWFPNFQWYAWRNPANNMRFLFDDPEEINVETNWHYTPAASDAVIPMEAKWLLEAGQQSAFRWLWSGPYAGYRRVWLTARKVPIPTGRTSADYKYSEIWFGWKVGSTVPGLGFTTQVRLKRKIGT